MTSLASAIWGTALGLTKLVASTSGSPAADSALMKAILRSVGTGCA
jgi:hypothetical protein